MAKIGAIVTRCSFALASVLVVVSGAADEPYHDPYNDPVSVIVYCSSVHSMSHCVIDAMPEKQ